MNCECRFVDMPEEVARGSIADTLPFLEMCALHQCAAQRLVAKALDERSLMRRRPGTGTVDTRGPRRFIARLPDDARTSIGTYATRETAERELDTAIASLHALGRLFGQFLCPHPVDWPDYGGVYVMSTPKHWPKVKIGRSAKLSTRLRDLDSEFGNVGLIAVLSLEPEDEPVMHARFAKFHEHGEWFRAEGELLEAISVARMK